MSNDLSKARQGDHAIVYAADGSIVGVGIIQTPDRWKTKLEVSSLDSIPGRGSVAGYFAKVGGFRVGSDQHGTEYIRNVEGDIDAYQRAGFYLVEQWNKWAEAEERQKEAERSARPEAVRLTEKLSHAFTCNGNKKLATVPLELLRPLVAWMEANDIEVE